MCQRAYSVDDVRAAAEPRNFAASLRDMVQIDDASRWESLKHRMQNRAMNGYNHLEVWHLSQGIREECQKVGLYCTENRSGWWMISW